MSADLTPATRDALALAARDVRGLDLLLLYGSRARGDAHSCLALKLGTPGSYADAFRRLQAAGVLEDPLADRLVRAAGFRNIVAHAYESLDMARVHQAATTGPGDLRRFLAVLGERASS